MRAYTVCIGVTPECRRTESEMIRDGQGCADKADEAYHDMKHQPNTSPEPLALPSKTNNSQLPVAHFPTSANFKGCLS